ELELLGEELNKAAQLRLLPRSQQQKRQQWEDAALAARTGAEAVPTRDSYLPEQPIGDFTEAFFAEHLGKFGVGERGRQRCDAANAWLIMKGLGVTPIRQMERFLRHVAEIFALPTGDDRGLSPLDWNRWWGDFNAGRPLAL